MSKKIITVADGIKLALPKLPKRFRAYKNPYSVSLVEQVRIETSRPYLPDGTIMRCLRGLGVAKVSDHAKGIYTRLDSQTELEF